MQTKTTSQDMDRIQSLTGDLILHPERLPVSFLYGGKRYRGLPAGRSESRFLDANIVETRFTARLDGPDGITLRLWRTAEDVPVYAEIGRGEAAELILRLSDWETR